MRPIYIFGIILLLSSCKPDYSKNIINVGDKIHHDDFEYSVSEYMVTRFLKNGVDTIYARGMFYAVTFRVDNHAKRVNHEWDNSTAYILDERGTEYENDIEAQQFYEKYHSFGLKEKYTTAAGSSDSVILIFDLPFNVTKPGLKVRGEILMGDIFDGGRFRKMLIRLF